MNITKAAVVMDNVPFHKHQTIKDKFKESSHILLFLPPKLPISQPNWEYVCEVEAID